MAELPSALSALQSFISQNVVDPTIGTFYEGQKFIIQSLDYQSPNSFEIVLWQRYPLGYDITQEDILNSNLSYKTSTPEIDITLLNEPLNQAITRLHLRSISFSLPKFEYATVLHTKKVINITHPDTITLTFLEDEFGTIRKFTEIWARSIAYKTNTGQFVFKDNQLLTEKNALIIVQNGQGLPNPLYPIGWLKMEGLKFEGTNDFTFSHDARDLMTIEVVCSVDNIWFYKLPGMGQV